MESENIPELRFEMFTEPWQTHSLAEMGSLRNGISLQVTDYRLGVPFLNLLDVFGKNEINKPELLFVDASEEDREIYNLLEGDVLFVRSSVTKEGIGSAAVCNYDLPDTVFSGFLIRYRTKDNILTKKYKKYCFESVAFKNKIHTISTSSVNTNLTQLALGELFFSFPSIPEQEAIANFLEQIDQKLTLLQQKLTLLENYKKANIQQLFSQAQRFTDNNNNTYPEWQSVSFSDMMNQQIRRIDKPNKDYKSVGVKSFAKGTFQKLDVDPSENSAKYLFIVYAGDLIINRLFAWEGAIAFAKPNDHLAYVSNNFLIYRLNQKIVIPEFFQYVIERSKFRIMLARVSGMSADRIKPLKKETFLQQSWLIPCIEEQKKIANYLIEIDKKIALTQNHLRLTERYKKRLLQKMFV